MERFAPSIWHPSRDTLTACLSNLKKADHRAKSADFPGRISGTPFWISARITATCEISWMDLDCQPLIISPKKRAILSALSIQVATVLAIKKRNKIVSSGNAALLIHSILSSVSWRVFFKKVVKTPQLNSEWRENTTWSWKILNLWKLDWSVLSSLLNLEKEERKVSKHVSSSNLTSFSDVVSPSSFGVSDNQSSKSQSRLMRKSIPVALFALKSRKPTGEETKLPRLTLLPTT